MGLKPFRARMIQKLGQRQGVALALHLIIDGYNLMGAARGGVLDPGGDLELARRTLLRQLRNLRLRKPLKITVVFDGVGAQLNCESWAGIKVAFAGGRGRADEAIIKMVRGNSQGVVVATSDRALGEACRRMGAAVLSSRELWGRLEGSLGSGEAGFGAPEEDCWEEDAPDRRGPRKKGPSRKPSRKDRRQARRLSKL